MLSITRFLVLGLVYILLHVPVALSTPHKTISSLNEVLQSLKFKCVSSGDNFEKSLRCNDCGVTLKFTKSSQAIWMLKRHAGEAKHQIKAGWFLDEDNNIKLGIQG